MLLAEETGLKLVLSETPKTGFLASRPIYKHQLPCLDYTFYPRPESDEINKITSAEVIHYPSSNSFRTNLLLNNHG